MAKNLLSIILEGKIHNEYTKKVRNMSDSGYCYAVLFEGGLCKVGRTSGIYTRIKTHMRMAKIHGWEVEKIYVSEYIDDDLSLFENKLIREVEDNSEKNNGEYFFSVDQASVDLAFKSIFNSFSKGSDIIIKKSSTYIKIDKDKKVRNFKSESSHCERALRVISRYKNGITIGVLSNRTRIKEKPLERALATLKKEGKVKEKEVEHKINGTTYRKFFAY